MSVIAEILISVSLVGSLLLCVDWFRRHRNLKRFLIQIIFLFGLAFILHAIFGYPYSLLRPKDLTISKGDEAPLADWPIYVVAYLAMVTGMLCQYLYAFFSTEAARRPHFDVGSFIAPIFVSPIIFLPLCTTLGRGEQAETGRYMIFLIAFENGFFFKGYFDQRSKTEHAMKNAGQ